MAVAGIICGCLSDWLINSGRISMTSARKLFQFIGHWVPAAALLTLAYAVTCGDEVMPIILLCMAVGFNGASYSGYQV